MKKSDANPAVQIKKELFTPPSGDVRGTVTLHMTLGKKERLVGHAYLLTSKPTPEITLDVPKSKLSPDDALALSAAIGQFANAVANA